MGFLGIGKRKKPSPRQQMARRMMKDAVREGDPFKFEMFKDGAGYSEPQMRGMFAHYLRGRSQDSTLSPERRRTLAARAQELFRRKSPEKG